MGEISDLRDELGAAFPEGVRVVRADEVEPQSVDWLWEGRIPRAELTLLVGDAGLGKSALTCDLAARVTRGQLGGTPADVVIASAEDSAAHTIVPRLIAAGARLSKVHFVTVVTDGIEGGIVLPDDIQDLQAKIIEVNAELVIIDPVVAHLSARIDSHRDHSVRVALSPLARLAARTGAAIVGIGHLNKGDSSNVIARINGSTAFFAAARSVLLFAADPPDSESDRALAHAKSNLSAHAVTLRYRVEKRVIEPSGEPIETIVLVLIGVAPEMNAGRLLRPDDPAERPQQDMAAETILAELEDGEQAWKAITAVLKAEGISERTGQRARDELRHAGVIDRYKAGLQSGWMWRLSEDDREPGQSENAAQNEPSQANFEDSHDLGVANFGGQVNPPVRPQLETPRSSARFDTPPEGSGSDR